MVEPSTYQGHQTLGLTTKLGRTQNHSKIIKKSLSTISLATNI